MVRMIPGMPFCTETIYQLADSGLHGKRVCVILHVRRS